MSDGEQVFIPRISITQDGTIIGCGPWVRRQPNAFAATTSGPSR